MIMILFSYLYQKACNYHSKTNKSKTNKSLVLIIKKSVFQSELMGRFFSTTRKKLGSSINTTGKIAFSLAVKTGFHDVMVLLIEVGASIETENSIYLAVYSACPENGKVAT